MTTDGLSGDRTPTATDGSAEGYAEEDRQGSRDSTGLSLQAKYLLSVLVVVSFLNYIDRQIIYIVGERVKQDLKLGDAQLGFLMGTALAVFFGLSGIGMGRIADAVSRTKLLALALAVWSGLTALSGLATNFATLAFARIGVGIGEAASNPCAYAIMANGFPARMRATVMSIYTMGIHIGSAASLLMGALVLQHWRTICTYLPGNACAIADWRAAFLVVGIPGVLVAVLVYRLREPPRHVARNAEPLPKMIAREMSAAIPPFTLWNMHDAGGLPAVARNLVLAAVVIALAWALTAMTGDTVQWVAIGLGAYSILTWGQAMKMRDPGLYERTFGGAVFAPLVVGGGLTACVVGAIGAWSAPYAMRILGAQPVDVALYLGAASAAGSALGVVSGGWISDRWRLRDARAPIWIMIISAVGTAPFLGLMMLSQTLAAFAICATFFHLFAALWSGVVSALVQDLVLPRMRSAAAASSSLTMIVISAGIGPYSVGKVSEITGSLPLAMLSILAIAPFAAMLFLIAARRLPDDLRRVRDMTAKVEHPRATGQEGN